LGASNIKWYNAIWALGLLAFATALAGQKVVDNPAKPAAKNAGRTVALEEIVTVRDGGEEFYFEWPRHIRAAPDGYDPLCFFGGRLYAIEENPDETAVLQVFRIADPGTK
jgi:hypothetical protein